MSGRRDTRAPSSAVGRAPKSSRGTALDIGDGFRVTRHGMDTNGNYSVWVSYRQGRAQKIQTNGNLPSVHHLSGGRGVITAKGAAEIKEYWRAYLSPGTGRRKRLTGKKPFPRNKSGRLPAQKTIGALRDEGDIWTCPGCGRDNVHSYTYALQVLSRNDLERLAGGTNLDNIPVATGSSFETDCGACRRSFAPRRLAGGARNPILHGMYTHEPDDADEDD